LHFICCLVVSQPTQVAKRKAEDAAAGQPAVKAGPGGVRRVKYDEDVNAVEDKAGGAALDVIGADDIQAEMALNEAAKGAVVVEAGNVQVGHGGSSVLGVHVQGWVACFVGAACAACPMRGTACCALSCRKACTDARNISPTSDQQQDMLVVLHCCSLIFPARRHTRHTTMCPGA
jgi:hypothetical protein